VLRTLGIGCVKQQLEYVIKFFFCLHGALLMVFQQDDLVDLDQTSREVYTMK
jgi:hypothetical protein